MKSCRNPVGLFYFENKLTGTMKRKVAIQGIAGSYHDIAARRYFEGDEVETIPCNTFRDVIQSIKKDPSILGLMAIENTIAGSLLQNHELIRESGFSVIGEYKLRISHSLVALPGTKLEDVVEINSHPIALMQCTDFLDTLPNAKIVEKGGIETWSKAKAEEMGMDMDEYFRETFEHTSEGHLNTGD